MTYLLDVNVLVYAYDADFARHDTARAWVESAMNGPPRTVGLPWPTVLGYLRIVTNRRIYDRPASAAQAWDRVEEWLELPSCWIPEPGPRHRTNLGELISAVGATGGVVPDAHLAALARDHGLTVISTDSDFAKYPGVRWEDPLAR